MTSKSTKLIILAFASIVGLGLFSTIPVLAINDVCSSGAAQAVKDAAGCNGTSDQLPIVIQNILYSVIAFVSIISVIFIVIGGVQYMSSSGDAGKVKKAKDTILYAVIGLIVSALAFVIINFVLNDILKQNGSGGDDEEGYIPSLIENDVAILQ